MRLAFWKIVLRKRRPTIERKEDKYPNIHLDTVFYSGEKQLSLLLVKAKNTPGIIYGITDIIASKNINILKLNVPDIAYGEYGFVLILVEGCDASCGEELKKEIKARMKDKIVMVDVISSSNSYVFLRFNKLLLLNDEAFIVTRKMLERAIHYVYNKGLLNAVAYLTDFGRGIGEAIYEVFISELMKEVGGDYEEKIKAALEMFKYIYKALGLGNIEITGLKELGNKYRIIIYDNFECTSLMKYGDVHGFVGKMGYLTKGIIEAFFGNLFNMEVQVNESECVLEGREADVFEVTLLGYRPEL